MKFVAYTILIGIILSGCSLKSPLLNITSAYDIYTIGKDERGIYTIIKDNIIQKKIQAKILTSSNLSNFDIDVVSQWAEVLLIGEVESINDKLKLIELAKNTLGVNHIKTYINLKTPNSCHFLDEFAILTKIKTDLISDSLIDSTNINIHIVQCDVVFSGAVATKEQEKRALWYALHTDGVNSAYSFLHILN
ncbi:BON domain-containing protein [Campylobacter sp.]|uniref:BON domain-containing protein n=1 Tax=Campylobacter sp. TaxID=205 RepID=UPI00259C980B|nr:BON domain-containing protein [Campylobacter sp.]MBQ8820835.1 BON domain-containing protein [Campylobacter sp.]